MYPLTSNSIRERKFEYIAIWLFFITIFTTLCWLSYNEAIDKIGSDLVGHITYAKQLAAKPSNLLVFIEPGLAICTILLVKIFSLSFNVAAPIVIATFYTAFVFVLFKIIEKELKLDSYRTIGMCFVAILVVPIFIPFVSKTFYLLIGSPNVWHSPTTLVVKLFSLYITYLTLDKITKAKYDIWFYFLATSLFISSLFKPSYAEVFIPALFIYSFFQGYKSRSFQQLRYAIFLAMPTIILLSWQFWAWQLSAHNSYSISGVTTKTHIIFTFFGLIKYYAQSPFYGSGPLVGFFRANAFPLAVLALLNKTISRWLYFCWIMLVIAYLQFAFLAESGHVFFWGNFTWGYNIALQLVFIFSIIDFKKWIELPAAMASKYRLVIIGFILSLLTWHLVSGVFYFFKIIDSGAMVFTDKSFW